ncbi:MAG: CARDB domain-containing protein [Methanoculleus sp.]|uniref:COG1361 S-layer family protein n=1 Tax=unclassified Methanoculleus TaxID=2619537 RepID=UPI0025F3965E|nr:MULTISPECIES: CARDB domain-containing protein [unclassified Methanoculleus]MCK9318347.1 S-layer protein [Methanoculleus sp.]MDD2253252.1 CARDB domain-containing protein [Methanoculleus sp.]MDD3215510.1 CARDB domain-containing protein [Methanoculleus sp.]MDD4313216.1 CARDB domain-containing protein [Methanoculleus sp.]MDD4469771.1 CARDB domain-containing protein [Methanoculleus sp.]
MERRTIGWVPGVLIVLLVLMPATATAQAPTVIVSNYTVTPAVLMPGDEGTITVVLASTASPATGSPLEIRLDGGTGGTNTSAETPENAYIENVLLNGEGVKVLTGSFQEIGEIGPGQSFPLTFQIRAPGEEGLYFPEVWVRVRDGADVRYPIPVNVNSAYALIKKPALRVERTVPASVDPGDPFNVTLTIYNEGQASASDVFVSVNATSGGITPKNSENYYIAELRPGGESVLNLTFETDTNAPLGLTPVLVTVDYRNADRTAFQQVATVGIPIIGRAEMGIASIRTEPSRITAGDQVDLTVRIENTGTADAGSVRATIEDLSLPGSKEAFLGTIEPGNDGPAVFALQADREGEFPYTLTIQYTDDYGAHTTEQALSMTVAESDALPFFAAVAAILIVAVVAAVFWYRRRKEE